MTDDPQLLDAMVVGTKRPKLALVVEIDEAFVHCGKALRRSGLWSGEFVVGPGRFPTMGEMLHDHAKPDAFSREELSRLADQDLHHNLY